MQAMRLLLRLFARERPRPVEPRIKRHHRDDCDTERHLQEWNDGVSVYCMNCGRQEAIPDQVGG